MDTKRFNIYAGSILGAALLFLLLNFFSSLIFFGPEHAGGEDEVLAFAVPVEDQASDGEAEAPDLATLVAEADPGDGERVFNKCRACHTLEEGGHGVGPSLYGVVGSEIAAAEGFSYSPALTGLEGEWTLEKLSAFLENPQGYAPGTKMSFAGIGDVEDRVAVIVFLNQADGSPVELVAEQTAAAEGEAAESEAAEGEAAEGEAAEGEAAEGEAAEGEAGTETAAAEGETAEGEAAEGEAAEGEAAEGEAAEGEAAEGEAAETAAAEGEAAEGEAAEGEAAETAAAEGEAAEGEAAEGDAAEGEAQAAAETGEDAGAFAELLANASAEEGEKVFRKCQACHTLEEGKHRVGPSLYGVIGSDIGSAEGFSYSDAMKEFEGNWTLANLVGYLEKPNEFMPGNKMPFPGLRDAQDRIDVLLFIDQADGERDLPE